MVTEFMLIFTFESCLLTCKEYQYHLCNVKTANLIFKYILGASVNNDCNSSLKKRCSFSKALPSFEGSRFESLSCQCLYCLMSPLISTSVFYTYECLSTPANLFLMLIESESENGSRGSYCLSEMAF